MAHIVVLMGPLEPIIQVAMKSSFSDVVDLRPSSRTGRRLIDEASRYGASAVIARRDEVSDLFAPLPRNLLVMGLASASWDVLIRAGDTMHHVMNPSPMTLLRVLREFMRLKGIDGVFETIVESSDERLEL